MCMYHFLLVDARTMSASSTKFWIAFLLLLDLLTSVHPRDIIHVLLFFSATFPIEMSARGSTGAAAQGWVG